MTINKDNRARLNFTDDELLYDNNSINIFYEDIELLEELRKQIKKHNPKAVERRNGMLIFDLVTKYCQYSETSERPTLNFGCRRFLSSYCRL